MKNDELMTMVESVVAKYQEARRVVLSDAYPDGGTEGGALIMGARLVRAVASQTHDDPAAPSRYGIWANTVRDHVLAALTTLGEHRIDRRAAQALRDAANSLSAFADVQVLLSRKRDAS